jgi:hypothetical protein
MTHELKENLTLALEQIIEATNEPEVHAIARSMIDYIGEQP